VPRRELARAWGMGAAAGDGERGAAGEGKWRQEGRRCREGEVRVREALHGRENEETKKP
jgi:hypothetical protein